MGHLHHEGFSPYTGEFPDLPFLLVVTARFPDAGARTGKTEVDGSDPPFLLPGAGAEVLRNSHLRNTPWGVAPVLFFPAGRPGLKQPATGKMGRMSAPEIHSEGFFGGEAWINCSGVASTQMGLS